MRRSVAVVALLLVLVGLAGCTHTNSTPTGTVVGWVTDAATGAAVASVRVAAVPAGTSGSGSVPVGTPEAMTDSAGGFRIDGAPAGVVDLIVRNPEQSDPTAGYADTRVRLSVASAHDANITIRLVPVTVSVLSVGVNEGAQTLSSDTSLQFTSSIVASDGRAYQPTWSVEGSVGQIDSSGNFEAGTAGQGVVRATLGTKSATAAVTVTTCTVVTEEDYLRPEDRVTEVAAGQVIIGYVAGAGARTEAWAAVDDAGGTIVRELPIANAAVAFVTEEQIESLRADWRVAYVEPNFAVRVPQPAASGAAILAVDEIPWNISAINADEALDLDSVTHHILGRWSGEGVRVGIIDTGISSSHPDLVVAGGTNIINPRASWADDFGHGTFAAGIIGARSNDGGIIGVAPNSELYAVKVLDYTGGGQIADVISGIEWCVGHGIRVLNLSLGISFHSTAVKAACDAAWNGGQGAILAAAAGNNEPVVYPANYGSVISVGAVDRNNAVASFSSQGPPVELCAPGDRVYSCSLEGGYRQDSGTSFSAPHVAGLAALLWSTGRYADAAHLRQHLRNTVTDLGSSGRDEAYGYGLINAKEAIDSLGCANAAQ